MCRRSAQCPRAIDVVVTEINSFLAREAEIDSALVASEAGVVIDNIDAIGDLQQLRELMHEIWGAEIVPPRNLLRGMAMAGSGGRLWSGFWRRRRANRGQDFLASRGRWRGSEEIITSSWKSLRAET